MKNALGLDIGSVNAKLVLVDENGRAVKLDAERITSSPNAAVASLISRLGSEFDLADIPAAGVSGSGRGVIPVELDWAVYSSSLAIASGLLHSHPDVKTILHIGGQTSYVIELEDGLKKPWKVASNSLCAAGTGRFVEQQAYRIGIPIEDFARIALECDDTPPRIAARCSVFAKTDLIHLQQKGVQMPAMLYALCESIARMVVSLKRGSFQEPVYFVGGVAANSAVLKALNEAASARNGHEVRIIVPDDYWHVEALGSALLAMESGKTSRVTELPVADSKQRYYEMPRLETVSQHDGWVAPRIDGPFTGYLGIDIGSTSTKAVILDESGTTVMAKNYLMTAGRPVEAVKEVFRNLLKDIADNATIAGVGITGSGRYLVGSFVGADLIKNEITAQTRAAADIEPDADIIEIGGQDSKLVIKRNGVVVDYQMNKACAAGTGSFIDELAEQLGVHVQDGQFARLAFDAPYTIDLGSRCAAFMGQAVASAQQEGMPLGVITGSLSNSIAANYLSKVLGNRKLGDKVVLTGAVFYNDAVVSAFKRALEGKSIIVPEHKEVSGAIGAALLAKQAMGGKQSRFKGFQAVIDSEPKITTFTCKLCDNNCTISRMEIPGEKPTFYGSRCDLFDSTISREKMTTAFDEREKLLFRDYRENVGTGPTVGIPRALLVYDYAPLLIGFLNALGARIVLSSKTTKHIMEQAVELSYTDSCFPVKLLHGHADSLVEKGVDYILYPSAIRMGPKEGDSNQKYTCPLIQASPYIIRQALGLGERLVIPSVDFSHGDEATVSSLADCAAQMGFSRRKGKKAGIAGIKAQREFEAAEREVGKRLLQRVREGDELGVVLLSRSYMSQDSGANLGIAEKLAQLGVVPIPLSFLPLESVSIYDYSDRPYWFYEGKFIAGSAITSEDASLFGLALTNFGCGPNSFILNIVEDIMGGKPLGELEIDEHAAEAGIVTRLEAFVDTISEFARSKSKVPGWDAKAYRSAPVMLNSKKTILVPRMAPGAEAMAAAMEAFGVRAMAMPASTEESLLYSNKVTRGTECLPYRVTLGDFLKFFDENGRDVKHVEGFMPSAFGPCRFGKYVVEQARILREMGFDLSMRTTVSNNAYRDMGLGAGFERLAWRGIVAFDYLQRLLWRTRPYEKLAGSADELFDVYTARVAERMRKRETFDDVLRDAVAAFGAAVDPQQPERPLVAINGEIFLRSNEFSNSYLVRACEKAGLEVIVSSVGEWVKYIQHRNIEDGVSDRNLKKIISGLVRRHLLKTDEESVAASFEGLSHIGEPPTTEILSFSEKYLSAKCGSEAVLSIGSGVEWLENPRFAGVISVMPHGCMPGGIVAAMSESLSAAHGKPWINLTYDGFIETTNLERINNFAEIIRFCSASDAVAGQPVHLPE